MKKSAIKENRQYIPCAGLATKSTIDNVSVMKRDKINVVRIIPDIIVLSEGDKVPPSGAISHTSFTTHGQWTKSFSQLFTLLVVQVYPKHKSEAKHL